MLGIRLMAMMLQVTMPVISTRIEDSRLPSHTREPPEMLNIHLCYEMELREICERNERTV